LNQFLSLQHVLILVGKAFLPGKIQFSSFVVTQKTLL